MTRAGIFFILSLEIFNWCGIDRAMDGFMICSTKKEYCKIGASRDFSIIRTSRMKPEYIIISLFGW